MPLNDFAIIGDHYENGSFFQNDLKALRNQKWVNNVEKFLSKSPIKYNIYVINHVGDTISLEKENGEFDFIKINKFQQYCYIKKLTNYSVAKLIGKEIPNQSNSITCLLFDNGSENRHNIDGRHFHLTPWILIHRMIHAIQFSGFWEDVYDIIDKCRYLYRLSIYGNNVKENRYCDNLPNEQINKISRLIGTTRSQREGMIVFDNELGVEALTQYIVQGRAKFNNIKNQKLFDEIVHDINHYCEIVLDRVVGNNVALYLNEL